jgi:hypothetical protein
VEFDGFGLSGSTLTAVGDWNGDGFGDWAVADPFAQHWDEPPGARTGYAWIFAGPNVEPTEATAALAVVSHDQEAGHVGGGLLLLPGRREGPVLLIGAATSSPVHPGELSPVTMAGEVAAVPKGFQGSPGLSGFPLRILGSEPDQYLGNHLTLRGKTGDVMMEVSQLGPMSGALLSLGAAPRTTMAVTELALLLENDVQGGSGVVVPAATPDGATVYVGFPHLSPPGPDRGWVVGFEPALGPSTTSMAPLRLEGIESRDQFGTSLLSDDFDGDGDRDLLVGSAWLDEIQEDGGAVRRFWGRGEPGGLDLSEGPMLISQEEPTFDGYDGYGAQLGWSLANVGDLDGDGNSEIAVGAPGAGWYDAGCVYLFSLPVARDFDLSDARGRLCARTPGQYFGTAVAAGGDLDADGYGDLLIGSDWDNHVWVVHGGPGE